MKEKSSYQSFLGRDIETRKEPSDVVSDDVYEPKRNDDITVGAVLGYQTGEADRDVAASGWAGTDDATSTSFSDLPVEEQRAVERRNKVVDSDSVIGRAFAGGIGDDSGGVTDIKGTPVGESRDWEHEPIVEES